MDPKLEEMNRIYANRVSPYQSYLNLAGKEEVINSFKYQLWQIWMIPLALTYTELICLKHGRLNAANNVALFKYASVFVGFALSTYFYTQLKHKIDYYDIAYPHAPQGQIEHTKDILMMRQLHN
jgi:hypothetical protein